MNTKLSNILKLTTVGITLLFASERAYGIDKHICASAKFRKDCYTISSDLYGEMGLLWVQNDFGGICNKIGAVDLKYIIPNGYNKPQYTDILKNGSCAYISD